MKSNTTKRDIAIGTGVGLMGIGALGLLLYSRNRSENMIGKIAENNSKHKYIPSKTFTMERGNGIPLENVNQTVKMQLAAMKNPIFNQTKLTPHILSRTTINLTDNESGKTFYLPVARDSDGSPKMINYTIDLLKFAVGTGKIMRNLIKGGFMGNSVCVIDRFNMGDYITDTGVSITFKGKTIVSPSAFHLIAECDKRFVVIPISQETSDDKYHAVVLFVDKDEKTAQIIDPNGQWLPGVMNYEHAERSFTSRVMERLGLSEYKFATMAETCPRFVKFNGVVREVKAWWGVQSLVSKSPSEATRGSCWLWSILFTCMRGLNPDKTATEIREVLSTLTSQEAEEILQYTAAVIERASKMI